MHPTLPYLLTSSDDMLIKLWDWDKACTADAILSPCLPCEQAPFCQPHDASLLPCFAGRCRVGNSSLRTALPAYKAARAAWLVASI